MKEILTNYMGRTFFKCMWMFCLYVSMCTVCEESSQRPDESVRSPGTAVTDGCELPCGSGNQARIL